MMEATNNTAAYDENSWENFIDNVALKELYISTPNPPTATTTTATMQDEEEQYSLKNIASWFFEPISSLSNFVRYEEDLLYVYHPFMKTIAEGDGKLSKNENYYDWNYGWEKEGVWWDDRWYRYMGDESDDFILSNFPTEDEDEDDDDDDDDDEDEDEDESDDGKSNTKKDEGEL